MKIKASKFMGPGRSGRPELMKGGSNTVEVYVSKMAGVASPAKDGKRNTFFNVDSLDTLVDTFDENERALRAR